MKMERLPLGLIPCIMLERSLIKDPDEEIKTELLLRATSEVGDIPIFEVEWITMGTTSKNTTIMIKCILATPTDYPRIIKLWGKHKSVSDKQFPTTYDYRPLALPHPRTSAFDQEINQAIARHISYLQSMTHTVIYRLPSINPHEITPTATLMSGLPLGPNQLPMTYLLRHGTLELPDGTLLPSPVSRVNMDYKGTRLYLHGKKTAADKLLTFTRELTHILPAWLDDDTLDISLDTSEADKAAKNIITTVQTATMPQPPQHPQ